MSLFININWINHVKSLDNKSFSECMVQFCDHVPLLYNCTEQEYIKTVQLSTL